VIKRSQAVERVLLALEIAALFGALLSNSIPLSAA
jgi:hypothetical protein